MAKFLIKATDNYHTDPLVDARGCYKYGDPVVIYEDTQKLGRSESFPLFFCIQCSDVSVDEVRHYLNSLTEQEKPNEESPPITLTRKRYGFKLDELPEQYKHTLFGTGYVELPFYILKEVINYKG